MFLRRYIWIGSLPKSKTSIYLDTKNNQLYKAGTKPKLVSTSNYNASLVFVLSLLIGIVVSFFKLITSFTVGFFPFLLLEIAFWSEFVWLISIMELSLFSGIKKKRKKLASTEEFQQAFMSNPLKDSLLSNQILLRTVPFVKKPKSWLTNSGPSLKSYLSALLFFVFTFFSIPMIYLFVSYFFIMIIPTFFPHLGVDFKWMLPNSLVPPIGAPIILSRYLVYLGAGIFSAVGYLLVFQNNPIRWLNAIRKYKRGELNPNGNPKPKDTDKKSKQVKTIKIASQTGTKNKQDTKQSIAKNNTNKVPKQTAIKPPGNIKPAIPLSKQAKTKKK